MKESLKDQQEKYFKYTLTGQFASTSDVATFDGFYRFQMPPLSSLGFTQNYQACLCKIKKVSITNRVYTSGFRWGSVKDATGINLSGGVNVLTNLASRNIGFLGSRTQSVKSTQDDNQLIQRFGCSIPASSEGTLEFKPSDSTISAIGNIAIVYQDDSDIKCSGTLTSVPFGQELTIVFTPSDRGATITPLYVGTQGDQQTGNGGFTIEMEFMMIES